MATLQQVVQLVFEGVDNASQTADSVTKSIGDLANKGKDLTQPLADATTGVLKFEAGLLAAGAALGIVAVNEADKFDLAFREIATLTNETVDNLSGFRQAILDYASTSTQSIDQVTGAIYTAISAGIDYKNSIEFVAASERLAVAGKAELTDTVIVLSGTLNAYGESSDQAAKYADILFNTVKQGQTTLPELSAALSGVTGTAVLGGVAFEEVAAALATLTASGAPTGAAVTRLNALLSAIIKPSSEAAKLAEELGLSWNSQTLKAKGLNGILADMAAKTGGAADKVAILTGGTEALSAANVLGISNSSKFNENLAQMQKSSGAVETAFNKMKDATDTLGQAFTVALISLGDPFLDEFNRIEDALASLATSFSTAIKSETFKPLLDVVENNLGKIGELIENIANNLPAAINGVDLKPFANSLNDLFKGISDLFNFDALQASKG
ncbi:MAG: phage tail tape measure protein [Candidatus Competibacteraceae bacterium]|nr:phage tail tape measure protein [Candidatus Competibacteraceae bacterium]